MFKSGTSLLTVVLGLLLISCHKGKHNPKACSGHTRREVKILTDNLVDSVDLSPILSTITALGNLAVPDVNKETERQTLEYKTYTVRGKVDKVKKEWDGDYHIRLTDGENYLITESPNTGCEYVKESAFFEEFSDVRAFIKNNDLEGKEVTVTGVAFVDIDHHYKRKQAKNNLELHPILSISF